MKTIIVREIFQKTAVIDYDSYGGYGKERVMYPCLRYQYSKVDEEVVTERENTQIFLKEGDRLFIEKKNKSYLVKEIRKSLDGVTYVLIDNPLHKENAEHTKDIVKEIEAIKAKI